MMNVSKRPPGGAATCSKRGLPPTPALRVFVSGGGCSGLQYGMALARTSTPRISRIIEDRGIKIVIDPAARRSSKAPRSTTSTA